MTCKVSFCPTRMIVSVRWMRLSQSALFTEEKVEALRDKLLVNYLLGYIPYLDEPAYNEYTKEIMEQYGLTEPPEFTARAYTNTRDLFPDSFAHLYIEK